MKIAVSTDERTDLIETLLQLLTERGHEILYFGPSTKGTSVDWPLITQDAVEAIRNKTADEGIVCCWTGTGASMVANKIPGVRAALCVDAVTAKGARMWNHANVLALSLRLTSEPVLKEILAAWFETPFSTDEWNKLQMERIQFLDKTR